MCLSYFFVRWLTLQEMFLRVLAYDIELVKDMNKDFSSAKPVISHKSTIKKQQLYSAGSHKIPSSICYPATIFPLL